MRKHLSLLLVIPIAMSTVSVFANTNQIRQKAGRTIAVKRNVTIKHNINKKTAVANIDNIGVKTYAELMRLSPVKRMKYIERIRKVWIIMEKQDQKDVRLAYNEPHEETFADKIATVVNLFSIFPQAIAVANGVPLEAKAGEPRRCTDGDNYAWSQAVGTCVAINSGSAVKHVWASCPSIPSVALVPITDAVSGRSYCIPDTSWELLSDAHKNALTDGNYKAGTDYGRPASVTTASAAPPAADPVAKPSSEPVVVPAVVSLGSTVSEPVVATAPAVVAEPRLISGLLSKVNDGYTGAALTPTAAPAAAEPAAQPDPPAAAPSTEPAAVATPVAVAPAAATAAPAVARDCTKKLSFNERAELRKKFRQENKCVSGGHISQYQAEPSNLCNIVTAIKVDGDNVVASSEKEGADLFCPGGNKVAMCNSGLFCLARKSGEGLAAIPNCVARTVDITESCDKRYTEIQEGKIPKGLPKDTVVCPDTATMANFNFKEKWDKIRAETLTRYNETCGGANDGFKEFFCKECAIMARLLKAEEGPAVPSMAAPAGDPAPAATAAVEPAAAQ